MADKLFRFFLKTIFVKGWYGEVVVKVEDGNPTRILPSQNLTVKELPE
jgi:hypothetical protein